MRRRPRPPRDSLDLLLDTMCNAFGGIVLIAILVALLIEKPGEADEESTPLTREDLAVLRKASELKRLEEEIRATEAVHEANRALMELTAERDRLKIALQTRQETEAFSMVELNRKLGTLLAEKNQLLTNVTSINTEVSSLDEALRQEEEKLARLEEEMKDVIASRTSETRPPEVRDASGRQVNLILEYGRVYPVSHQKIDRDGRIYGLSLNEETIHWEGDIAIPIPDRGLSLESDQEIIRQMFLDMSRYNRLQASLPSEKLFIVFFTYADSFEILTPLRSLVNSAGGIEDGWEPREKGLPIAFSTDGRKSQVD